MPILFVAVLVEVRKLYPIHKIAHADPTPDKIKKTLADGSIIYSMDVN